MSCYSMNIVIWALLHIRANMPGLSQYPKPGKARPTEIGVASKLMCGIYHYKGL